MESFVKNPGLQHLAEEVFLNLDSEKLKVCGLVNKSCQEILANPLFWLKKFIRRGLSEKNQMDWIEAIRITRDTDLEAYILRYLKRCSKNEKVVDIPCFINKQTLKEHSETIRIFLQGNCQELIWSKIGQECECGDRGILQILALFLDDPNTQNNGDGLMKVLICGGKVKAEILKIFLPLINDPINPNPHPMYLATSEGNLEVVKLLASLNPNYASWYLILHIPAIKGFTEIVRFLAPLVVDPNFRNLIGMSALDCAKQNGHQEIVKILSPFAKNH